MQQMLDYLFLFITVLIEKPLYRPIVPMAAICYSCQILIKLYIHIINKHI